MALAGGLARQLHAFNAERREIEAAVLAAAIAQVEQRNAPSPIVFALGADWHAGVIGIVASKMVESGSARRVLLCAGDKMSSITNWDDRQTAMLFGDAALFLDEQRHGVGARTRQ